MMKKLRSCFPAAATLRWHWAVGIVLFGLTFLGDQFFPGTQAVVLQTFADAYIGVSVFVALTLLIFYGLEYLLDFDTQKFLEKNRRWHVPLAAFLGALPGCGGAIMVLTQYVAKRVGFGSVVAALAATMGDAAFLLLAQRPQVALLLFVIAIISGTVLGWIVERIHGRDFLAAELNGCDCLSQKMFDFGPARFVWFGVLVPGLTIGLLDAFQVSLPHELIWWVGVTGALVSLVLWLFAPYNVPQLIEERTEEARKLFQNQVIFDTNFVTVWVILAFLSFELTVLWTGFDFSDAFKTTAVWMPLIGTLIGFLPGCGPQIVVTTLYLAGVVPFSAQLANSISNDGDALFPAIALAPRAAVVATLYTAIPAVGLAYAWYFLFEV